jgi:hypothetical protein
LGISLPNKKNYLFYDFKPITITMRLSQAFLLPTLTILLLSMKSDSSKKSLLCHHWVQVASTSDMNTPVKPTDASMAQDITFKADGTYDSSIYNGQMKTSGNWYLNDDETKMDLTINSLNGKDVSQYNSPTRHYNIILLKLTADTLVYGNEFYHGKEGGPLVYNHSDLYFVRKD